jgi:hypothetical protein
MAYEDFNEFERPDADEDEKGVITTTRVFKIWYANGTDGGAVTVLGEADLPQRGDSHPDNSNLICRSRNVSAEGDDKCIFTVTCNYSTVTTEAEFVEDPLKRPAEITWGFFETQRAVEKDNNNDPIDNSAGDPFLNPIIVDDSHLEVTITRNESKFLPDRALSFIGSVNDAAVTIAGKISAARQAKLVQYTGSKQTENDVDFWKVTYRIRFKSATWDKEILDQGFNQLVGGVKKKILDDAQQPITDPVKLDGLGAKAGAGVVNYETFQVLPETDFQLLGLMQ